MLQALISRFHREDRGQDLSEYCLLTALVALLALGVFLYASGGVKNLWNTAGTTLATGASISAGSGGGASGSQSQSR